MKSEPSEIKVVEDRTLKRSEILTRLIEFLSASFIILMDFFQRPNVWLNDFQWSRTFPHFLTGFRSRKRKVCSLVLSTAIGIILIETSLPRITTSTVVKCKLGVGLIADNYETPGPDLIKLFNIRNLIGLEKSYDIL